MDIEKLREQHKDLTTRARAIQAVADDERRELAADEAARFEDLINQAEQVAARIVREDALRAHEDGSRSSFRAPTRPQPESGPPLTSGEPRRFRSLGEQLQAIHRAGQPGGRVDPRLTEQRAILGLNETAPGDGGVFVQTDFSTELLRRVYETGQLASRARRIPLSSGSNGVKIPAVNESSRADGSRWGGVRAYWTVEGGTKTASQPTFRDVELNLHKLTALVYVTDELLQDAAALESYVSQAVSEELAFRLDDAILNGTGTGQPLGILNAAATVSVAKETGQVAATLQSENLVKMYSRMWPGSTSRGVWFHNVDILPQLLTTGIQVGVGGSTVFMPAGGLSGQPYNTLFGRPMVGIEQAATLGTVGDIVFADMSQYLLIDRPVQTAMSIHVQFLTDQTVFRFVYRVDGQPAWHAALTPKNGSNTLSPYITLATRA